MATELKNIRVRHAKPGDHGLFRKLWQELAEAQFELGNTIIPNEQNLETMTAMFTAIVSGEQDGVVIFVSDAAVLMYGEMGNVFETTLGSRIAFGFGHYVVEEHRGRGILDQMTEVAFAKLKEQGFEVMLGSTMEKDTVGLTAYTRCVEKSGLKFEVSAERPNFVRLKE